MQEENKQDAPRTDVAATENPGDINRAAPIELIELGQSVDQLLEQYPVFADAVKAAIAPFGGEFLFDLPHSERVDGKGRVAAIRMKYAGSDEMRTVFVFLSDDAMDAHAEPSDKEQEHLKRFAESFVGVLERIAAH